MTTKTVLYWGDITAEPHVRRHVCDYTHVRLHHFCRPQTFDSYREPGIRVFQHQEIADKFHQQFADVPEEHRLKAIKAGLHGRLPPRVDAALDDRYMISQANHYSAYGSEVILGLTNHLPSEGNYRERLKSVGRPAVIIFEAPVEELEGSAQRELDMYLGRLADGRYEEFVGPNHEIDFTASFFSTVPPDWIVEYRWLDIDTVKK